MGRSRMVDDGFWDDADLVNLTTEERFTLILFMTCKQSNVIGVFRVIWRSVGAGSGWTHDQVLNAARNLQTKGCIEIDEATGWVWVKEWWKHNSLRGAFTGNVGIKARRELLEVPDVWKTAILEWIAENDCEGACKPLTSPLQWADGNPTPTTNLISISTTTTTDKGGQLVADLDELVDAAVWSTRLVKEIRNEAGFRKKVKERVLAEGPSNEDLIAHKNWRAHQRRQTSRNEQKQEEEKKEKVAAELAGQAATRMAKAKSYLNSLEEADRAALIEHFLKHLAATNSAAFSLYRSKGLQAKIVETELLSFVSSLSSPTSEEAA